MNNQWDDAEAEKFTSVPGQLVYAARLLGQQEAFGITGSGSASAKLVMKNLLGDDEEILYIDHGQQPAGQIMASGFTPARCKYLASLALLETISGVQLANELACSRILAAAPVPPVDTLLHAILPFRYILAAQPDAVLAVASTPRSSDRLREIYLESVLILPYVPSGLELAQACAKALQFQATSALAGIFVMHQGLIAFGDTAKIAFERMVDLVGRAEQYLEHHNAWQSIHLAVNEEDKPCRQELAVLRKEISVAAGFPLILRMTRDPECLGFCQRNDLTDLVQPGPAAARHSPLTKRLPMIGRDVEAYRLALEKAYTENIPEELLSRLDPAPRIVLDPDLGLGALGRTAGEAVLAERIYRHTIDTILRATALEGYRSLPPRAGFEAELSAWTEPSSTSHSAVRPFTGEVALVTGGASGIGKACVESLLARGAAVVSMDINPMVKSLYHQPDYLGLECDLTDEAAIIRSFEAMVRTFGGLDMLVLNAGIFPAGCRIESLSMVEWQKVMHINLDSNVVVLREAYPLLKCAPCSGRVLVNASKNVLAPGAGAAAYSSAKAAVTQLGRIAALEWGKDHIRVNMIHPDAIFDTGIWTEEVLKARAAHYGMSVQQYKTRNVLGVELNSHYVGELVAEMLGPRFEKITGAQIPVDGGSDRVI